MKCAVIHEVGGIPRVRIKGTYDDCIQYMRTHTRWSDLIYLNEDGSFGRLASWVL
jgi:hypothetical protein